MCREIKEREKENTEKNARETCSIDEYKEIGNILQDERRIGGGVGGIVNVRELSISFTLNKKIKSYL